MIYEVEDNDFAVWAFGDVWHEYLLYEKDSIDLVDAWNYRHSLYYELSAEELILDSMKEMKKLYEKTINAKKSQKTKSSRAKKSSINPSKQKASERKPKRIQANHLAADEISHQNTKIRGTNG